MCPWVEYAILRTMDDSEQIPLKSSPHKKGSDPLSLELQSVSNQHLPTTPPTTTLQLELAEALGTVQWSWDLRSIRKSGTHKTLPKKPPFFGANILRAVKVWASFAVQTIQQGRSHIPAKLPLGKSEVWPSARRDENLRPDRGRLKVEPPGANQSEELLRQIVEDWKKCFSTSLRRSADSGRSWVLD